MQAYAKKLYRSCNKEKKSFFRIQITYFNAYLRVFPNLHTNAFLIKWPLYIAWKTWMPNRTCDSLWLNVTWLQMVNVQPLKNWYDQKQTWNFTGITGCAFDPDAAQQHTHPVTPLRLEYRYTLCRNRLQRELRQGSFKSATVHVDSIEGIAGPVIFGVRP